MYDSIDTILKTPRYVKSFILSFSIVFLLVILQNLGIKAPSLISPTIQKAQVPDVFEKISPKLENFRNNFTLQNNPANTELNNEENNLSDFQSANAYLVVDLDTGQTILSKDAEKSLPIASLTKIMTAIVSLDLSQTSELFTVSQKAENTDPTKIGVIQGQKMSVLELLNALILTSANDAAQVLEDGVDQKFGDKVFIKAMNAKAKFIGLQNTNFANPQGFDNQKNYSSARDLAVLTHYALTNYPTILEIAKKDYQFLPEDENHKQFDLYNWNGLIDVYPGTYGLKIGYTDDAGKTTVVVSQRSGKKLAVVLLGAPTTLDRDLWAAQLLDQGFQKAYGLEPVSVTEEQLKQKYTTWKFFE